MSTGSASRDNAIHIEDALDACLEQMESGVALQDCLVAYPSLSAKLEPLLSLAVELQGLRQEPAGCWPKPVTRRTILPSESPWRC